MGIAFDLKGNYTLKEAAEILNLPPINLIRAMEQGELRVPKAARKGIVSVSGETIREYVLKYNKKLLNYTRGNGVRLADVLGVKPIKPANYNADANEFEQDLTEWQEAIQDLGEIQVDTIDEAHERAKYLLEYKLVDVAELCEDSITNIRKDLHEGNLEADKRGTTYFVTDEQLNKYLAFRDARQVKSKPKFKPVMEEFKYREPVVHETVEDLIKGVTAELLSSVEQPAPNQEDEKTPSETWDLLAECLRISKVLLRVTNADLSEVSGVSHATIGEAIKAPKDVTFSILLALVSGIDFLVRKQGKFAEFSTVFKAINPELDFSKGFAHGLILLKQSGK